MTSVTTMDDNYLFWLPREIRQIIYHSLTAASLLKASMTSHDVYEDIPDTIFQTKLMTAFRIERYYSVNNFRERLSLFMLKRRPVVLEKIIYVICKRMKPISFLEIYNRIVTDEVSASNKGNVDARYDLREFDYSKSEIKKIVDWYCKRGYLDIVKGQESVLSENPVYQYVP